MKLNPEEIALLVIIFCFLSGAAYLWGYSTGASDHKCYITESE